MIRLRRLKPLFAISSSLVSVGTLFLAQMLLARLLGADSYGTYAVVLALVSLVTIALSAGINFAAVRVLPTAVALADQATLRDVDRRWRRHMVWLAGILGAGAALLLFPATQTLGAVAAISSAWACLMVASGVIRGWGWPLLAIGLSTVGRSFGILGAVVIIYMMMGAVTLRMALWATLAGTAIVALLSVVALWLVTARARLGDNASSRLGGEWRRAARAGVISDLLFTAFGRLDVVILGFLASSGDVGLLAISLRLAEIVALPHMALSVYIGPTISLQRRGGGPFSLRSLVVLSATASAFALFPILAWGQSILALMGPEFIAAIGPLSILATAHLLSVVLGGLAHSALLLVGAYRSQLRLTTAFIALRALATVIGYDAAGLTGAATAIGAVIAIHAAVQAKIASAATGLRFGLVR
jgi:O-antigen/teichoic acid export membrane protein